MDEQTMKPFIVGLILLTVPACSGSKGVDSSPQDALHLEAPTPPQSLDDAALDALLAATQGLQGKSRLEAAIGAVGAACTAAASEFAGEALALADEVRATTQSLDCSSPTWDSELETLLSEHDGQSWLVLELSGRCVVPADHADTAAIRIESRQKVELRGAAGAVVDGAAWSAGREERTGLEIASSSEVVIRSLEFTGIETHTAGADAGGVLVESSTRVVLDELVVSNVGVDYDNLDNLEEGNAFGIKLIGTSNAPSRELLVRRARVEAMRTGQSENITLAGDVTQFAVIGSLVFDVDNIGIDLIGGEDYGTAQAHSGLLCGNGLGGQLAQNPAYPPDGDAAAAGLYLDGGGSGCIVALNFVEGFSNGYEVGSEGANPTVENAHLFGNVSVESRGAGLLIGSLAERVDPKKPTDRQTLVQRHVIVGNSSADVASCLEGGTNDGDGAAQCEGGSVERRGVEVCVSGVLPASVDACAWQSNL